MSGLFDQIAVRIETACDHVGVARAATAAVQAEHEPLSDVATVLVVPAAERWLPIRDAGLVVSQQGGIAFACVVALTFPAGFAEWETVRAELLAALRGWMPTHPEAAMPIHYSGARLLAYAPDEGGRWLHAFDFLLPSQATYEHQT